MASGNRAQATRPAADMETKMTKSQQLIAHRDRILSTPEHLREFEQKCTLNSIDHQIAMAQAEERRIAEALRRSRLKMAAFSAVIATAEYAKGSDSRKGLLAAVSDLYLEVTR